MTPEQIKPIDMTSLYKELNPRNISLPLSVANKLLEVINMFVEQAIKAEKERCAGIAENYEDNLRDGEYSEVYDELTERIAKAIRDN